MFKKIKQEFKDATSLEKFNTLSSIFTVSGLSMLTIFNAVGSLNYEQITIAFFVFGAILLLISIILAASLSAINSLKKELPTIVLWLLIIGMVLLQLGFLTMSIFSGIELIKSFG